MNDTRPAQRYAAALFGLAERDGILDSVSADLDLIERFLREAPYIKAVLMQPTTTESYKTAAIERAFGDRITATSLSYLRLLIHKRRENQLDASIRRFRQLLAEKNNTVSATATSATPLPQEQWDKLRRALERRAGKTILLEQKVDPELLGGLVVQLEDSIIDGSVRGRLNKLEQLLLGNRLMSDPA